MKRSALVSALLGTVLICVYGISQSVLLPEPAANFPSPFSSAILVPAPLEGQSTAPFLFVTNSVGRTNLPYSVPWPPPILPPRQSLFDSPQSGSNALPPGLYKTEPYTCLVLVPGPHPDDKCIIGNGTAQPNIRMPMRQPGLQFIPRKPSP